METTFSSVAKHYTGCLLMVNGEIYKWHSYNVQTGDVFCTNIYPKRNVYAANIDQAKPILRHITSLTHYEDQELFYKANGNHFIDEFITAAGYIWLLSNHFDIFGLIDTGQAIDLSTLPTNPYTL